MKNDVYVWVRLGDASEYASYEDIAGATDSLVDAGVQGPFSWGQRGHLYATGYEENNYISFFWGDNKGNFKRDLNRSEKMAVEKELIPLPTLSW